MELFQEGFVTDGAETNELSGGSQRCDRLPNLKQSGDTGVVVIVHRRALDCECLSRSLQEYNPALAIAAVGSLEELQRSAEFEAAAVVMMLGSRSPGELAVQAELKEFVSQIRETPVVVVADGDEPADVLGALDSGATGYVPTSEGVKVLAHAIALARCGGSFVPASCVLELKALIGAGEDKNRQSYSGMLTNRQAAVAKALREGKPNKIIAYDLNMCESTVKVHVREIMKKLKASNRTQAAYRLSEGELAIDITSRGDARSNDAAEADLHPSPPAS